MKLFRKTEGIANGTYFIGDEIEFILTNGEHIRAIGVKYEKSDVVFCSVDCLQTVYPMRKGKFSRRGYKRSDLRETLNTEILDLFPPYLREMLKPLDNGDFLRIPTEIEIFGYNHYGAQTESHKEQWTPMREPRYRVALQGIRGESWASYWLQNDVYDEKDLVAVVSAAGRVTYGDPFSGGGVRLVFKL